MEALEWIRFFAMLLFLLAGLSIFFLELFGVVRFKFVLNRMQAAAIGDTLGISLCMIGLMIANGLNFTSAKLLLVIIFLWFASPVSSHVIARLEVTTDSELEEHLRILPLEKLEKELDCGRENKLGPEDGTRNISGEKGGNDKI